VRPEGATDSQVSDWSLLDRASQKDEVALSALYDRYSGLVFSEAKRIFAGHGSRRRNSAGVVLPSVGDGRAVRPRARFAGRMVAGGGAEPRGLEAREKERRGVG
jgi:hypothetical protein